MSENVRFILNKEYSNGKRSIQLRTTIKDSLFTYQTGYSLYPELWDKVKQRPIKIKGKIKAFRKENPNIDIDLENINEDLINLEKKIKTNLLEIKTKGIKIDFKELRSSLNRDFKETKKTVVIPNKNRVQTLNLFIERYIKDIENGTETYKIKGKVKKYSPSTIKVYKEWKTQYLAYQKNKKKVYQFEDITMDFYNQYVDYFVKKNYSNNSIGKQVKHLKAIMQISLDRGLHNCKEFKNKAFATLKEDTDSIYLTNEELQLFYDMDLSERPHLERTRDIFLVGCWTALRFSDYSRIKPDHIKTKGKNKFIEMFTQKTKEKVIIPIRPELNKILKKYSYNLPRIYEQKLNFNIKVIAEELEINEQIDTEITKGGLTVILKTPKYKLIKTHTARRTGATLMYQAKIPVLDIMKITGHRKPESLLKYIKQSKEETAEKLSSNPFFTGQKLRTV